MHFLKPETAAWQSEVDQAILGKEDRLVAVRIVNPMENLQAEPDMVIIQDKVLNLVVITKARSEALQKVALKQAFVMVLGYHTCHMYYYSFF